MYCVYCGKKLGKNANFCGKCGKLVQLPSGSDEENMEQEDVSVPEEKRKTGISKTPVIVAIVLCALIVAAAITVLIVTLVGKDSNKDVSEGRVLLSEAIEEYQNGDYAAAEESFTEAAEIFMSSGNTDSVDFSTAVLGAADSKLNQGDVEGANDFVDRYIPELPGEVISEAHEHYDEGTDSGAIPPKEEEHEENEGSVGEEPIVDDDPGMLGDGENQYYQNILDDYTDAIEHGSWSDVSEERAEDSTIARSIADRIEEIGADNLYFALVDLSGDGNPVLLIAVCDSEGNYTCVDAFTTDGRVFDNIGGDGADISISVLDSGTLLCDYVTGTDSGRTGEVCLINEDDNTPEVLDTWETESASDEITNKTVKYGDQVTINWTKMAANSQTKDTEVQVVEIKTDLSASDEATDELYADVDYILDSYDDDYYYDDYYYDDYYYDDYSDDYYYDDYSYDYSSSYTSGEWW